MSFYLIRLISSLLVIASLNLICPQISRAQVASENLKDLAQSPEWLKLLRYEGSLLGLGTKSSVIHDKDFFFSANGKSDPHAEILANIEAMSLSLKSFETADKHPACRFPARYKWLRKKVVGLANQDQIITQCEKYNKWSSGGRVTSISIYFATGYFGNPASFFGHPLLKFNVGNGDSQLVDASLNYGAMTPSQENPILYVLKGLFGGYKASFTRHDFFYHNHNYSETEMRDLWEYRLNLDPEEVQFIVDHTWELLGRSHPYFFFSDNCAHRMAELLEVVYGKQIVFRNGLYIMPIDLFSKLATSTRQDGRPMVTSITRVPSRYSRFSEMYNSLSESEKNMMKLVVGDSQVLNEKDFTEFNESAKAKIIDTGINYYSFLKLKYPESTEYNQKRTLLLRERFKVEQASKPEHPTVDNTLPPNKSQNSLNLQAANVYSEQGFSFQEFAIRPALYDEMNPSIGRPNNTSLVVFDTRFRFRDNKLNLRSFDLFRVSALNTPNTDLPKDGNLAWKVQLGLKSQSQLCEDCLVSHFSGGLGLAQNLLRGLDTYLLLKGGLQDNRNEQGTLHFGTEIGAYIEPYSWWKILLSYEREEFLNGLASKTDIWKFEQRFGDIQSWDIRTEYYQRDDKQFRLSLNFYL